MLEPPAQLHGLTRPFLGIYHYKETMDTVQHWSPSAQ